MLDEQLWAAVEKNDRNLCTLLVDQGADPNKKVSKNTAWSPLRYALFNSKTLALIGMLDSKKFKFTQDNAEAFAWSVIQAINTFPSCVPLLLSVDRREIGLSLANSKAPSGYTSPLKALIDKGASITDAHNLASLLVQHGDDPNLNIPGRSFTALEFAIQSQAWSVVLGILASPGFIFKIGVTEKALELAIKSAPLNVVLGILTSHGFAFKIGVTEKALTMAIKKNSLIAESLLKHRQKALDLQKAEPSPPQDKALLDEPLWAAVEENNQNFCKILVSQGADPNKKDTGSKYPAWSPLSHSLKQQLHSAVHGMLQSPQFKFTRDNPTALGECVVQALCTNISKVTLLLSASRDPEVALADYKYASPLRCLISRSENTDTSRTLANHLVRHEDDPNVVIAGLGKTPLEYAIDCAAWNVAWGIVESPGFVFKIGVTDNALTLAIKLTDNQLATHLLKLRKEAVERQESESIHVINKYFTDNLYISLDCELKKLDKIDPLKTIMLAMNNKYVDLTVYLIKSYFSDKPMDLSSVLRPAVEKGYLEVVRVLLERKVNPNQVYDRAGGHKSSPLFLATEAKNYPIMDLLVSAGADINFFYKTGENTHYTLLQLFIEKGVIDEVQWLVRRKEFNFTELSVTELMYSIFHNQIETTNLLLSKCTQFHANIDSHVMHRIGGNVLYHAVTAKNVKAIKILMDLGANPMLTVTTIKESPLLHAVKTSRDHSIIPGILIFSKQFTFNDQALEALRLAIDAGKQRIALQLLAKYGDSKLSLDMALWKASLMGLAPVVARLLELGANPNMEITGDKHVTPLWASLDKQDPETQELLLKAGANVHYGHERETNKIRSAYTLLVDALVYDKLDSFLYFISRDEFKFKDNTPSALLVSLKKGYMHIFDKLLEKYTGIEFNLDVFSYLGDKAIHIAVRSDNIPAVRSLLMRGSNPLVRLPNSNHSALMLAVDKPEIFELLVSLGQFEFDEHCVEVVLECIEKNQPDSALSLLTAHPPAATMALDSCFAPAMKKGFYEITELLLRHGVKLPPEYAMTTVFTDAADAKAYWSKAPCKSASITTLRKSDAYKKTVHSTYVKNSQEIMESWDAKNPPASTKSSAASLAKKTKKASLTFMYDSSLQNCVEFDMLKEVDYGETAARDLDPGLELPTKQRLGT